MKRLLLIISALFVCTVAIAHTINWHVDGNIYQTTTCDSGESITPPTAPYKYGYHLAGWGVPIEYLESTGTQWIDTGFYPNNNSSMEIKFICGRGGVAYIKEPYVQNAWGIWNSNYTSTTMYYPSFSYLAGGISQYIPNTFILAPSSITLNQNITEHNNTEFQYQATSVGLFTAFENSRHLDYCTGKIYYAKFYDGNVLVHNFIPVLDSNNVPCMYDKVTKRFFYNAGTGQFIAGPVVSE